MAGQLAIPTNLDEQAEAQYNQNYMTSEQQAAAMQNPAISPQQKQLIFEQVYGSAPGVLPEQTEVPPPEAAPRDTQGNIDYSKLSGAQLEQIVSGNFMQGLSDRKADLQRMVDDYNYQKQDNRTFFDKINWKPMAALYDSWNARAGTPTNLAAGMSVPESNEERASRLNQMQAQIMAAKTGLTRDEQDYLKERLRSQTDKEIAKAKLDAMLKLAGKKADKSEEDKNRAQGNKDREFLLQLDKSENAEIAKGNVAYAQALDDYQSLVEKYGDTLFSSENPEVKSKLTSTVVKFKEAARLGALAGPDWTLAKGVTPDDTYMSSWLQSKFKGGKEGILRGIEAARDTAHKDYQRSVQNIKTTYGNVANPLIKPWEEQYKKLRKPGGSAPPKKALSDMSIEEKRKYLEDLKKANGAK